MDDDAGVLLNHRWEQGAIQTDGRHQVLVQLLRPLRVGERCESAARCAGATKHVDEDVNATELLQHRVGDRAGAFGSRKICGEIVYVLSWLVGHGARGGHDLCSGAAESLNDGGSDSLRSTCDQSAAGGVMAIATHRGISTHPTSPPARFEHKPKCP